MRFLRDVLNYLRRDESEALRVVSTAEFRKVFERIALTDGNFTTEYYAPGTSGETKLYKDLREQAKV